MIEILFNMHASKNKHVRSYHYAAKENIYRDVKEFKIEAAVKWNAETGLIQFLRCFQNDLIWVGQSYF